MDICRVRHLVRARSAEFLQTGLMNNLRWLRVFGDSIFAIGVLVLGYFVFGLITVRSFDKRGVVEGGHGKVRPKMNEAHLHAGD